MENEKLSYLFEQRALKEAERVKYADWVYGFHVCMPWLSVCWIAALNHFLNLGSETKVWIFMGAVTLYFFFSWLWWKKLRIYSRKIVLIDKEISWELKKANL